MLPWRSHTYRKAGVQANADPSVLKNAIQSASSLHKVSPDLPVIFTLKHLSHLTGINYSFLRECIERSAPEPYRRFRILKRPIPGETKPRYRIICVPDPRLMSLQRWINQTILQKIPAHASSVAFAAGSSITEAASRHCGCRWLVKVDIQNFFESVTEQQVYHVFSTAGYQPLVAFELARLSTRQGRPSHSRKSVRWKCNPCKTQTIESYRELLQGHLPQGAPTSPILANLVMRDFDRSAEKIAEDFELTYTRYADDLTFSTSTTDFNRSRADQLITRIYNTLRGFGFLPKLAKTKVSAPGARKVVLGLLVDGDEPRLSKQYRDRLRQHLHYMTHPAHGPVRHAETKGFNSVYGLQNHIRGLIAHASQIDQDFATKCWRQFNTVNWP